MKPNRIQYLDFAKGIAVLSMIIAHNYGNNDVLFKGIYSFHMPLFFIVSGYFFHKKPWRQFFKDTGKRLLLPYAFSQAVVLVSLTLPLLLTEKAYMFRTAVLPTLFSALLGSSRNLSIPPISHCGPIWFLIALAVAMIFFNSIIEAKYCGIIAIIIAYIGYASSDFIILPFSVQPAMVAVAYLYIGHAIHEYGFLEKNIPWPLYAVAFFCWYSGAARGAIHISAVVFPAGLFSALCSVCGSFIILKLSKHMQRIPVMSNFLIYCGRNSLCLLCMHSILKAIRHWAPYTGNVIFNCFIDVLIPLILTIIFSLVPVTRYIFGLTTLKKSEDPT